MCLNAKRRNEINKVIDELNKAGRKVENIVSDEQDYYDNIPEPFLSSERAEMSEEAIDNLSYAKDMIDEALDYLKLAKE